MSQQHAADTRVKVRRLADGERINVEWSFLEPGGIIGDESERAETDLVALNQSTGGNHDDENRKNCNSTRKLLRHLPQGGRQLSWF